MGVRAMVFSFRLVIVDNLNIRWAGLIFRPVKTDAPLVIDPNGVLPLPRSLQCFQPVGVERGKIASGTGSVENAQSLLSLLPKRFPLADLFARCEMLRVPVTVTPYHPASQHYQPQNTIV